MTRPPAGPLLALALLGATAHARAEGPTTVGAALGAAVPEEPTAERPATVTVATRTSATLAFVDARSWLGRADGAAPELGLRWRLALHVEDGPHDLDANLAAALALAPAPDGDDLVKGADGLVVDARWVRHLLAWFGPYVRAGARSSLLRATDDRDGPTRYRIERPSGDAETRVAERLALTEPLLPITLHQAVGGAIRPVRTAPIAVDLLAGIGGRETFADGQRAIVDDPETATIEVLEARDAAQLGVVAGIWIAGALDAIALRYRLRLDTSFPIVRTDLPVEREETTAGEPGPMDLASLDAGGLLSFDLGSFASVGYEFEVAREPLVLDAIQFRSSLGLSFGVSIGERPPPRR